MDITLNCSSLKSPTWLREMGALVEGVSNLERSFSVSLRIISVMSSRCVGVWGYEKEKLE